MSGTGGYGRPVTGADDLNLKQVAQHLGVHYITAYRYVRTGRLPARRVGTMWLVDPEALSAFEAADSVSARADLPRRAVDWVDRLHERFLVGDEAGAWAIVEGALIAGWAPEAVLVKLIGPAVAATVPEDGPAAGHLAASTAQRTAAVLASRFRARGRIRGTVVLGAPSGEGHGLGLSLLTDLLRIRNLGVAELGVDVSPEAFVDAGRNAERLVAVAIGVTDPQRMDEARSVVLAVRDRLPGVPILLGGSAVVDRGVAELAGADAWSADLGGVGRLVDDLLRRRTVR